MTKSAKTNPTREQLLSSDGAPLVSAPIRWPTYPLTHYRVTDPDAETFAAERLIPTRTIESTGRWSAVHNDNLLNHLRALVNAS